MSKEFIEVEGEHWYPSKRKKDIWYPSITTIISVFPKGIGFNKYLANQSSWEDSQDILKAAGRRGTNVHEGTEKLERGETLDRTFYSIEEWQMLEGFVNWHHKYNPTPIHIELGIVSDKQKTGGTIDRIYTIDGVLTLLDIKTSGSIYDSYWAQTGGYALLWDEKNKSNPIVNTAILRLTTKRKDKYEYVTHTRDEIDEDQDIFKGVQKIWNYINPSAKPRILDVPDTLKL